MEEELEINNQGKVVTIDIKCIDCTRVIGKSSKEQNLSQLVIFCFNCANQWNKGLGGL